MSLESVEVVRACFEAFDRSDLSSAADRLDPDVEWDNPVLIDEQVLHGRRADLLGTDLTTFPLAHEEYRFVEAGEQVCVLAQHTSMRRRIAGVETVEDGRKEEKGT